MPSWGNILVDVPKRPASGLLLFLTYINDFPEEVTSLCKIFEDDISFLSKAICQKYYKFEPNKDLKKSLENII